jgi:hypothetical protein
MNTSGVHTVDPLKNMRKLLVIMDDSTLWAAHLVINHARNRYYCVLRIPNGVHSTLPSKLI